MKKKLNLIIILLLLMGVYGLEACTPATVEEKTIKIGVIAPITGEISNVGQSTVNAVELAAEQINAEGGMELNGVKYKIVLIIEDNEDNEQKAVSVAQKLINQEEVD